MTDGDFEHLYERAGAALRAPASGDDAARDRLVNASTQRPPRLDDAAWHRAASVVGGACRRGRCVCRRTRNRTRDETDDNQCGARRVRLGGLGATSRRVCVRRADSAKRFARR